MLVNEEDGEVKVAKPHDKDPRGRSEWHYFQLGRDQLPPVCCDCLNAATLEHAYKWFVTGAIELAIPALRRLARVGQEGTHDGSGRSPPQSLCW